MGLFSDLRLRAPFTPEYSSDFPRIIDAYLNSLSPDVVEPVTTIIAQSPASPLARAIVEASAQFLAARVGVRAIFARLDHAEALKPFLDERLWLTAPLAFGTHLRWAKNPCLLDAHEQLTLGNHMCWSGDPMRREPGKVNGLAIYAGDCRMTTRLARLSFEALWSVSAPLPGRISAAPVVIHEAEILPQLMADEDVVIAVRRSFTRH